MSEQVRDFYAKEIDFDNGPVKCVLKSDYDALHAEAEALRSGLRDPGAVLVGMLRGDIAKLTPRGIAKVYGEVLNGEDAQHVEIARLRAEAEALRAENGRLKRTVEEGLPRMMQQGYELRARLEAARGLLSEMDEYLSRRGDGESIHTGSKFHMAIDDFLTATPAPEVRVVNQQFTAEQGERQEAWANFDEMELCMHEPASGKWVKVYTTPQPGPDVRGLVEAGNPLSNVAYNLAQKPGYALTEYDCELLSKLRKRWDEAARAHRQAQRKGEHP